MNTEVGVQGQRPNQCGVTEDGRVRVAWQSEVGGRSGSGCRVQRGELAHGSWRWTRASLWYC